jgi:hypothetical protein
VKKRSIVNVLLIFIPGFWACLIDLLLTINGQPLAYWQGNLQMVREGNPLIEFLMKNSLSGIFIFVILWLPTIVIIGYYLNSKLLRVLALFVLFAHTFGATSWLAEFCGFWTVITYVVLNSALFIAIEDIYSLKTSNE